MRKDYNIIKLPLEELIQLSKEKGYLSFDDVIKITDKFNLSIIQIDKIYNQLLLIGITINDVDIDYQTSLW